MSEVRETKTSVTYYRRTLPPVMVIFLPRPVSQSFRKAGSWPERMAISLLWNTAARLWARAAKCSSDDHLDCWPKASQKTQQWFCWRHSLPALIKPSFIFPYISKAVWDSICLLKKMLILQIHLILMYSSYSSLYSIMFLNMRFHLK